MHVESYDRQFMPLMAENYGISLTSRGKGGRATQRIELDSIYTGPVFIDLSDIRQGGGGVS